MKKILVLTLLLACVLCGCAKKEPQPPYFKDVAWGDSIKSIEKLEPDAEKETNGNETTLVINDDDGVKDTGSDPFPFEPTMVKYTFEDDSLKSIYLAGFVESNATYKLIQWIEERFESKGEMEDGGFLCISKASPSTALKISFGAMNVPDEDDESILYHYVQISLLEYNAEK